MFQTRNLDQITGFKIAVGVILLNETQEILLEKRTDSKLWGLPGGRLDYGEDIKQTATREVLEETGFKIDILRFQGIYSSPENILSYPNGDIVQPIVSIVVARVDSGSLEMSHESEEIQFFSVKSLPENIMPCAHEPIADFFDGKQSVLK